ncbi:LCP family protein [Halalkalibacter kiskunsagensis]|uniref:Regulatory protein MsrR n=1 Tax=Halalkalibacter kiskunsagensis TaxID=1548599 RepID=A0ABV6K8S0_9BACI
MSIRKKANRRKQKRRYRPTLFFSLLVFLILFGSIVTYAYTEYHAGKTETEQQISAKNKTNPSVKESPKKDTITAKEPENNQPINVLLVGVDSSTDGLARTDTIMIGQYNPLNGEAKLASIMRDVYVEIPGRSNNKINAAFAFGGVDLLQETIEQNFKIDIHYYTIVNFAGFINTVDTIVPNGLPVTIEQRMFDVNNQIDFQPGNHRLHGEDTLKYVRFRKDNENDFGRVRRQQETLKLLKDELFTLSGMSKIPRLIGALEPHLETNLRTSKMLSLGRDFVLNPIGRIETIRIPIDGSFQDVYYQHAGAVLEMNLDKNRQAIYDIFNGSEDEEKSKEENI